MLRFSINPSKATGSPPRTLHTPSSALPGQLPPAVSSHPDTPTAGPDGAAALAPYFGRGSQNKPRPYLAGAPARPYRRGWGCSKVPSPQISLGRDREGLDGAETEPGAGR